MITLPNPAVAVYQEGSTEPVTGLKDSQPRTVFMVDPEYGVADGIPMISYLNGDDTRGFAVPDLTVQGRIVGSRDGSVTIRAVDPYDAVTLAPEPGCPQPVEVVRAEVLQGGGALAQELDAVVAPDNTVATLILETGLGTYVRFSGDWQRLDPDSNSLEDMSLVQVAASAVDIWDKAESARTTVSVFQLPTVHHNGRGKRLVEPPVSFDVNEAGLQASATSTVLPLIASAEDVPVAVRYASLHPDARWYVVKRAQALGKSGLLPASWTAAGVMRPFEQTAAV